MERWPSGRRRSPAKRVRGFKPLRGFKSLPLRPTPLSLWPNVPPVDRDTQRLVDTLIEFADTAVSDFDPSELAYRLVDAAVELAGADQAGLLLKNSAGDLQIGASTSGSTHLVELLQLQVEEGPCLDAFRSGEQVVSGPLDGEQASKRWPRFADLAVDTGFNRVYAVPMKRREQVIGSLNLFQLEDSREPDMAAAKALADLSTIAILQDRAVNDSKRVIEQLKSALDSRVVIEQAKGMLSERTGVDVGIAFERLRSYVRSNNLRLRDVAERITSGELIEDLIEGIDSGEDSTP